jgi:hypothetical protein
VPYQLFLKVAAPSGRGDLSAGASGYSISGFGIGRLPGDISYKGRNFSIYVPLGTSILISIVLSGLLYLFWRFRR